MKSIIIFSTELFQKLLELFRLSIIIKWHRLTHKAMIQQPSFTSSKWNLGLKMMVKSGVEKIFLKLLYTCGNPFLDPFIYFKKRIFAPNDKLSNKNDFVSAWRDFNKKNCGVCTYDKWNFKPKISPIFHFELVNEGWIRPRLNHSNIMC